MVFRGEHDRRGGELLGANEDVCMAVQRVGEYLGFDQALIDECVADLPAEELDQGQPYVGRDFTVTVEGVGLVLGTGPEECLTAGTGRATFAAYGLPA